MTTYTLTEATDYLQSRAELYGGDISDILNRTPVSCWDNPDELVEFWEGRDLSHIYPRSTHPWLAEDWDNIIAEDPGVNRARGAEVMTDPEINDALLDNELDAIEIDSQLDGDSTEFIEELLDALTP